MKAPQPLKLLSLIVTILFISCENGTSLNAKGFQLPDTFESGFSIELYDGGGMTPESEHIFLSKDSCYYAKTYMGSEIKLRFTIIENEQKMILDFLKEKKADKIRTKKLDGIIHDKGTTSITFNQSGGKRFQIADGATESIEKSDLPNFRVVWNYLYEYATKKTANQKVDFTFYFEKAVLDLGKIISISFQTEPIYYSSEEDGLKESYVFRVNPGVHHLQIHLLEPKKDTNGSYVYYSTLITEVNTKEFSSKKVGLKDGKLVLLD